MRLEVFAKTLRDSKRAMAWWTFGLLAVSAFIVALYPTVRESAAQLSGYVEKLPKAMRSLLGGLGDYASPSGYLRAELFGLQIPILFLVIGIGAGARAIGGEEDRGTLETLLATPIGRARVLVEKFIAMVAQIATLGAVMWIGIVVTAVPVGMHVSTLRIAEAMGSLVLLGVFMGSIAMLVTAWRKRGRSVALGVTAAFAVASYLANALYPSVSWLRPARFASAFYYYAAHDPISNGLDASHVAVLVGATTAAVLAATRLFERRDLAGV